MGCRLPAGRLGQRLRLIPVGQRVGQCRNLPVDLIVRYGRLEVVTAFLSSVCALICARQPRPL
jgi:hypothetical protein